MDFLEKFYEAHDKRKNKKALLVILWKEKKNI